MSKLYSDIITVSFFKILLNRSKETIMISVLWNMRIRLYFVTMCLTSKSNIIPIYFRAFIVTLVQILC